jgi:protoheme IX farnesyltransferase
MISLKDFLIFTKFRLSFTVSLSLVFGFALAKNSIDIDILYPFLAVLILALGVSSLNQVQEYKEDSIMPRTKDRPIAANRLSPTNGFIISSTLILISFYFIYESLNILGVFIFIAVVVLYNGFYTYGKKKTIYAAVFGAVLGIIPPMIGWMSAQKELSDIGFLALALFYFIWQIPHFWLLTLKYCKEYKKAKFPTVVDRFGIEGLERITFIWLLLTVIAGLYLVLIFQSNTLLITIILVLINIYTIYTIFTLRIKHNYLQNFIVINSYMVFTMLILMIDKLFFLPSV